MSRRAIISSALLVALAMLVGVTYLLVGNPLDPFDNKRFSAEAWRRATEAYDLEARARMCRDLIKHFLQPGIPEKQVVRLIGPPDQVEDGHGSERDRLIGARFYRYYIGNWSFQGMDDAFLYVHFDSQDRVIKVEIYGY
jgi:hypothetical protein